MRIIAGEYSSRRIAAPEGRQTRPTLDKVREAVFSALGGSFSGGVFLDLYAGSGANGLEALSRGMEQAVFVDCSRAAVSCIKQNIASLGVEDQCLVLPMKDWQALSYLKEHNRKFTVVYLDPPYQKQHNGKVLQWLSDQDCMTESGVAVIEAAKEDVYEQKYGSLVFWKEKIYGITRIIYYRRGI